VAKVEGNLKANLGRNLMAKLVIRIPLSMIEKHSNVRRAPPLTSNLTIISSIHVQVSLSLAKLDEIHQKT
jgi:hypothetical protein